MLDTAPWQQDSEAELLRFPAGIHDDQVDALGLIGQLLDSITAPAQPPKPEPPRRARNWFEDGDDDLVPDWRVA